MDVGKCNPNLNNSCQGVIVSTVTQTGHCGRALTRPVNKEHCGRLKLNCLSVSYDISATSINNS